MSLDTKIRRFCEVDPMEFFGLPPKLPLYPSPLAPTKNPFFFTTNYSGQMYAFHNSHWGEMMARRDSPPPIPELDLSIEPPFAEFIDFGGASKHRVTNSGSAKLVFKVKCSNNQLYKVNPVYAFLNPGASVELQILRAEGPNRNDKLIIMFKTAVKGERDPRKQFQLEGDIQKKALALITRDPDDERW